MNDDEFHAIKHLVPKQHIEYWKHGYRVAEGQAESRELALSLMVDESDNAHRRSLWQADMLKRAEQILSNTSFSQHLQWLEDYKKGPQ